VAGEGEETEDTSAEAETPSGTGEAAPPEAEAQAEPAETPADRSGMRYRKQRRGGKGLRDIRTSDRNGPVVAIVAVRAGDELMVISQQGMVTRMRVDEIRVIGRNTQGVRLINLNEGDKVVGAAKIAREEGGEEGETPEQPAPPEATDGTSDEPT
jgi:DNA gyrase subunit A